MSVDSEGTYPILTSHLRNHQLIDEHLSSQDGASSVTSQGQPGTYSLVANIQSRQQEDCLCLQADSSTEFEIKATVLTISKLFGHGHQSTEMNEDRLKMIPGCSGCSMSPYARPISRQLPMYVPQSQEYSSYRDKVAHPRTPHPPLAEPPRQPAPDPPPECNNNRNGEQKYKTAQR